MTLFDTLIRGKLKFNLKTILLISKFIQWDDCSFYESCRSISYTLSNTLMVQYFFELIRQ